MCACMCARVHILVIVLALFYCINHQSYERSRIISIIINSPRGELLITASFFKFRHNSSGMCVGERRRIIVPPVLAYGSVGVPRRNIPPNATLVYDVSLVSINGLATPQ